MLRAYGLFTMIFHHRLPSLVVMLTLVACGTHPQVVSPPETSTSLPAARGCLDVAQVTEGTPAMAPRHQVACTAREADQLGPVSVTQRTFDADGHVLTERFERLDDPPRGTVNDYTWAAPPRARLTVNSYDASGRRVHEVVDDGLDGIADEERQWAFDQQGRDVGTSLRTTQTTTREQKRYGAAGALVLDEEFVDEVPTSSTRWLVRDDGAPLSAETFSAPGMPSGSTAWHYDDQGRLHQRIVFTPSMHASQTDTYDEAGRVVEVRSGWTAVSDAIRQVTYDEHGNTLRDHRFDTTGQDIEDLVQTFDARDHLLTDHHSWGHDFVTGPEVDAEERVVGPCGEVLSFARSSKGQTVEMVDTTYDQAGHAVFSQRRTFAPDPVSSSRSLATFDAAGHLTHLRDESLVAGAWATTLDRQREFDAEGHLVLDQWVSLPSGLTTRQAWAFDANGDLAVFESNANFGRHQVHIENDFRCLSP